MQRAVALAARMRGHVWPNPPVGCVIVQDGGIIAEASTAPGGRPHAERQALELAGEHARGATLYVTLEPCCHWGKTPPCTDAIIAAGVDRVVCALQDPDPRVNGGGFENLRRAGIAVSVGPCKDAAQAVMSGFLHRIHTGTPELVVGDLDQHRVPEGVDAVLSTLANRVTLATRRSAQVCPHQSAEQVLRWMGALGLTTVAVPAEDPFWRQAEVKPARLASPTTAEMPTPHRVEA